MEAVPAQQTHLCSLSVQPCESGAAECQTWRSFERERAWSCRHPVSNAAAVLAATRRRPSGASSRTAASRPFTHAHAHNLLLNASISFPSLQIRAPPPSPPPVCSLSFFSAFRRPRRDIICHHVPARSQPHKLFHTGASALHVALFRLKLEPQLSSQNLREHECLSRRPSPPNTDFLSCLSACSPN